MGSKQSTELAFLRGMLRHKIHLQTLIEKLRHELAVRAGRHDMSRLEDREFPEAAVLSISALEHGPDSMEYKRALNSTTIRTHRSMNSHHPEHFSDLDQMGWMDIIEMVLDWSAAVDTYGLSTFAKSVERNLRAYPFSEGQTWLIRQVAAWVKSTEGNS